MNDEAAVARRAGRSAAAVVRRLRVVAGEELEGIDARLLVAQAGLSLLPVQAGARTRCRVLRLAGVDIGRTTIVLGPVTFSGPRHSARNVHIGEHCVVNFGCVFEGAAPITIGDRVGVGQQVMILTNGHVIDGADQRMGPLDPRPVTVADGAWISSRSLLLPGVEIGRGSVVAAGSVVTRSVPPDVLVGGAPARVIRSLC